MTEEQKKTVFTMVDTLKPKKKAALYLVIKDFMEKEKNDDSWLEAAKPQFRIHKVKQDCQACEG